MRQIINSKYRSLFQEKKPRYIILMGGRGAGRSTVASQYAAARLLDTTKYFRCAIMRYVASDIRHSIFQEILDRLDEGGALGGVEVSEFHGSFKRGDNKISGIGFRKSSSDQKSKLKSLANYNTVIIEEADEINEDDFIQLDDSLRTVKGGEDVTIIFLLNPPSKNHWIIKRFFNLKKSDVDGFYYPVLKESMQGSTMHIFSTYLDNARNISQTTRENYEEYKRTKPDHYANMIKGLVSEGARGRIFTNWQTMKGEDFDKIPYPSYYGLDFGFTNDPTSLIEIKSHNRKVWLRQLIYETGLTNQAIARRLAMLKVPKHKPIYADSAEPKSIRELQEAGYDVVPAEKGPDSIKSGIDELLECEITYTEDSTAIANETQEYRWALDKNKEPTNEPIDDKNHAIDATRYGYVTHKRRPRPDAY